MGLKCAQQMIRQSAHSIRTTSPHREKAAPCHLSAHSFARPCPFVRPPPIHSPIQLPTCPPARPPVCPPAHRSVRRPTSPHARMPACPPVQLSARPSADVSICPSVDVSICPSVDVSICPSADVSMCPSADASCRLTSVASYTLTCEGLPEMAYGSPHYGGGGPDSKVQREMTILSASACTVTAATVQ